MNPVHPLLILFSMTLSGIAQAAPPSLVFGPPSYAASLVPAAEQLKNAKFPDANAKALLGGYLTGWEFCQKYQEIIAAEPSLWVEVPVSYDDPSKGTTPLFAYFRGSFDAKRPTFLFFDGGPGTGSHDPGNFPRMTAGFNELHFDQRGIGCSAPATLDVFRDPAFYSTINTVRDADRIRQALGIDRISIYGDSYGTVPATVYASTFASHTAALVLEGTYFSGALSGDHGRMRNHLQAAYAALPEATKQSMLAFFDAPKGPWIYSFSQMLTYMYPAIYDVVPLYLKQTFPAPGQHRDTSLMDPASRQGTFNGLNEVSQVAYSVLNCKEMPDKAVMHVPFFYRNAQGAPVIFEDREMNQFDALGTTANCRSLGVKADAIPYRADQFQVPAPVTYYQGSWDTATDADGAHRHSDTVPAAAKQVLLSRKGSHLCHVMATSNPSSETARAAQVRCSKML